ncbi:hypothetical protein [Frigidibacter sp. MR17.24]|uniref:hypothetical protein n=1 Tax=Frigidibacter sp. MR17.24 TaxID=3127345 RepID=UPI00301303BB
MAGRAWHWRQARRGIGPGIGRALVALALLSGAPAAGQPWSGDAGAALRERTALMDIFAGSRRSDAARSLGRGGYELAGGGRIAFADWYHADRAEVNLRLVTALGRGVAVIWGVSTGESGPKYRIDPGLWLGLGYSRETGPRTVLSISAVTLLGGRLVERDCKADYGAIGGLRRVNCRLAAGLLPPEETLRYRLQMSGRAETQLVLRLEHAF